jgi:hypothetical protein
LIPRPQNQAINSNQITGAAFMGTVGLDWQIIGVGNFSSIPGESDMVMPRPADWKSTT